MTPECILRHCFRTDAVTEKTEFPDSEEEYDSEDSGSSRSSQDELNDLEEVTDSEEETKERKVIERPPVKYIDPT